MNQFLQIGQIVSTFGLKGQVKVFPLTDFLERFEVGSRLRLNDDWVTIESATQHKNLLHLKLSGVKTIEQAEALKGVYLEVPSSHRPTLDKDEYYTQDLIGLQVETVSGEELGKVDNVVAAPAQDVIVVGEIMIPAVKQFVKKVDLKAGKIMVELIPGMRPGEE